jgi:hypothetical protein
MGFNNGRWLCIVYKNSAFFREIMGHSIVPSTTPLQHYLKYSIFLSLVSCFTSQFGKLRGKYPERAHFLPMTDWKMVN